MVMDSINNIVTFLPSQQRLIGLDLGSKTIGIALSDLSRRIASPCTTIHRTKFQADADLLEGLANEHAIGGFVLGLPLNMNASEGPRVQSTRSFAKNLAKRSDIPIVFWDERLSTVAAERVLLEADVSRRRRAQVIDKMAATYILQGALDYLSRKGTEPD